MIVEPLVQAAAGMRLVDPGVYAALRDIEPLVIFDEIATGFGRTGTMFAFEQTGAHPDLLCLGKGITGGALALSCTLARRRIYEAFLGDPRDGVHFLHGHSYAGNPIACAAALASLDLFDEEGTLERAERIASRAATHLQLVRAHPLVRETRQAGTMIGIELAAEATDPQHGPTPGRRIATGSTMPGTSRGRSVTCSNSFRRSVRPIAKSTRSSMRSMRTLEMPA